MANLNQTIDIQTERKTGTVSRPSFGLPLLIGVSPRVAGRVGDYADISAVAEDFQDGDPELAWSTRYFAQTPTPNRLLIASPPTSVNLIPTAANSTVYAFRINGTLVTYTSAGSGDTVADIIDGLVAAIPGSLSTVVAATDNTTDLDLDPVGGVPFKFELDATNEGTFTVATTSSETPAQTAAAVSLVRSDYFVLAVTAADVDGSSLAGYTALADYAEANKKMFAYRTLDPEAMSALSDDDLAAVLNMAAYNNTFGVKADNAGSYSDAALIGAVFSRDVGTVTAKFRSLTGIIPSVLTGAQQAAMDSKKLNYYNEVGGRGIVQEGTTAVGEYIDVIRDLFWLEFNIQADVYAVLINNGIVRIDSEGIAKIEGAIRARLSQAVGLGIVRAGTEYVTAPTVAGIPLSDRGIRLVAGFKYGGELGGAVHFARIRGTFTL